MPADARVLAFIARHHQSDAEAARADVAHLRGLSLEERGRLVEDACQLASATLAGAEHPERVLEWQDPPHPTYPVIMARLRERHADWRWPPELSVLLETDPEDA